MGVWGSQGSPRSGDLLGQREGSAPSRVLGWRAGLCTWQQQEATASQDTSAQHCDGSGQQKDNSQHRSTCYESSGNSFPTLFFFSPLNCHTSLLCHKIYWKMLSPLQIFTDGFKKWKQISHCLQRSLPFTTIPLESYCYCTPSIFSLSDRAVSC